MEDKVKKKFQYEGIELRIVEREEDYMNSKEKVKVIRVVAPSGKIIPLQLKYKQTLKSIVEETVRTLDGFRQRGADVKVELLK